MALIFVSSTFVDLVDYRQRVIEGLLKLGHQILAMEYFTASDQRPLDGCLAEVERCDIYIGLFAWRLGYIPAEGNPEQKSITELELRYARKLGKTCLVFLLDEDHPWLFKHADPGSSPARPIDRLRQELRTSFMAPTFRTPEDLATQVVAAVARAATIQNPPQRAHPLRQTAPVPVSRALPLPGRLAAATIGRLGYLRARRFVEKVRSALESSGLERSVVTEDFKVPLQLRGPERRPLSGVLVVAGPAGAGKTTYVSEILRQRAAEFDLIVLLRGGKLAAAGQGDPSAGMTREILDFFSDTLVLERERRLSPAAISYALSYRKVLLIMEDLHHAGAARDVLARVRAYFEKYHRWSDRISIIATTRESREDLRKSLGNEVDIQEITPLRQNEAQEFFFLLCRENGVDPSRLVEHGEKIARAFPTDAVRTPLFIVICAWLASPISGVLDVGAVLEMQTSEVFDTFIAKLHMRSGQDEEALMEFKQIYQDLALALWPDWEDCREDLIVQELARLAPRPDGLRLPFFERNGFLVRPWYQGSRFYFPHQAMADFLAASAMVRRGDFTRLAQDLVPARREGLVPFLAERITQEEHLAAVAELDLLFFVQLAEQLSARGARQLPVGRIIERMARCISDPEAGRYEASTWVRLRDLLERRAGEWWSKDLARLIDEAGEISPAGIEALVALDRKPFREALLRRLSATELGRDLMEAARTGPVQEFLLDLVRERSGTQAGRTAFRLLWAQDEVHVAQELERWTAERTAELGRAELEAVCRRGPKAVRLLGEAVEKQSLDVKQTLSSVVLDVLGQALIPCGLYEVPGESRTQRVRVSRPLLVPPVNEPLFGRFNSLDAVKLALQRKLGEGTVMTYHQAVVALNHFSHQGSMRGVLFNPPQAGVPEVFWSEKDQLGLYVIPNRTATAIQPLNTAPPSGSNVVSKVSYRRVSPL